MPVEGEADPVSDGLGAARAFKFYGQFARERPGFRPVQFRRVAAVGLYSAHRDAFDRTAEFFRRAGADARRYLRFMAVDWGLPDRDLDSELVSRRSLNRFVESLAAAEKRRKIYGWYSRSVKAVAEAVLAGECSSAAELIRKLIRERKLAPWVVGGRISAYYLAAIPGFPKIVSRLDRISRDELRFLAERYDMYNTDVNEAVREYERRRANPVRAADEMVERLRAELSSAGQNVFDESVDAVPGKVNI